MPISQSAMILACKTLILRTRSSVIVLLVSRQSDNGKRIVQEIEGGGK